jgi:L-ascorbate metabolism protein UlaG (beta-lactamase superfamily)
MNRSGIGFRWLGVAGVELTFAGRTLVVDPFFTRPSFLRLWVGRVRSDAALAQKYVPGADYLLVSHAHYDHLMDAPAVLEHTGASAYGSANACRLLALCGVAPHKINQIHPGDRLELEPFQVEVLPSEHLRLPMNPIGKLSPNLRLPLRLRDYRMDEAFSFCYTVNGLRVLDWRGELTSPAAPADILLVPPFGDEAYYAELLEQVQPRLVFPNHWDDFFRPLTRPIRPTLMPPSFRIPPTRRVNMDEFTRRIERLDNRVRVIIPEIFRQYDLNEDF